MPGQADIGIRVFLDDAASVGLGQINSNLAQMFNQLGRANTGWANMKSGTAALVGMFTGLGASLFLFGGAVVYSVKQAEELQAALTLIELNVHGASAVMPQLTASLVSVADASIFSGTEIAQGIAKMGTYGFTAKDMLANNNELITSMVNLAEATGQKVLPSAEILSRTMQLYGLNASHAAEVSNVLDASFKNGQNNMVGLSDAFAQVGGIAHMLGISLQDTAITLDILGQSGIKGAMAGTDLRYMLTALTTPTNKAAAELQQLGIISTHTTVGLTSVLDALQNSGDKAAVAAAQGYDGTAAALQKVYKEGQSVGAIPLTQSFIQWATSTGTLNDKLFDAKGNFIGLHQMLDLVAQSMKGMNEQAREDAVSKLFNVRSGQAAAMLVSDIMHLDDEWTKLSGTMKNTSAQADAARIMQDFGSTMKALQTTVQNVAALIGLAMLPSLTSFAQQINGVLSMLTSSPAQLSAFGNNFLRIGTVMAGVGVVAALVGIAIAGVATPLFIVAGIAIATVAGVVGLSAALALLVTRIQSAPGILNSLVGGIRTLLGVALVLGGIIAGIRFAAFTQEMLAAIPAALRLGLAYMQLGLEMMVMKVQMGIAAIQMAITNAGGILPLIGGILRMAAAWLVDAAAMLLANAPLILVGAAIAIVIVGLGLLIAHLMQTGQLMGMFRAVWASIGPPIMQAGNAIRTAFLSAVQQLYPVWTQLVLAFNNARPALMFLGAIIGGLLVAALVIAIGLIVGFLMALSQIIIMAIRVAAGLIQAFMGIIQFFSGFFTLLRGIFTGNQAMILAGWNQMGAGLKNIWSGIWSAISAVVMGVFGAIAGFIGGAIRTIISLFQNLSSVLVGHSIVPDMMNAIMRVFSSGFAVIAGLVRAGISIVTSVFQTMQFLVTSVVTTAMAAVRALFSGGINAAAAVVMSGVANIIAHFMSMPGPAGAAARAAIGFMMQLGGGVMNAAGTIAGAVGRVVGAFQSMAAGIGGAISGAIGWVNNLIGAISHIPSIGGMRIPGFAQGAIVTSPTLAVVGEGSEPEMVIPLSQYQQAMQGAANMARSAGNGGGQTIVNYFQIDGRTVASSVFNTLTGQLQMNGLGRMLR